jgi:ferredoxin--NADP+ reductase
VAWYNGHPDFRGCHFDLAQERAAVVGVGNVAIDVARILCRTPEELRATDMADYAVEALSRSNIREVYLLGRRGPAQAAFTNPEIKEVGELSDADVITLAGEVALDPLSQAEVEHSHDRIVQRKIQILQGYALRKPSGKSRKLIIRFLVSPVELIGDAEGRVTAMRLVRNTLVKSEAGTLVARPTGDFEELSVGLVFRSVGYRGVALPGVPFHDRWGVILNEKGRVIDPETRQPLIGQYTSGWIKRGPSGVVGTNKPDSVETANCMLEDLARGRVLAPAQPEPESIVRFLDARGVRYFTYADWKRLDQLEVERGHACGRPRVKYCSVEEMLAALER